MTTASKPALKAVAHRPETLGERAERMQMDALVASLELARAWWQATLDASVLAVSVAKMDNIPAGLRQEAEKQVRELEAQARRVEALLARHG